MRFFDVAVHKPEQAVGRVLPYGCSSQAGAKSPSRFMPAEIGELMHQLVEARGGQLSDPIEEWAYAVWSYTEGYKGLTGLCLREVCGACL